MHLPLRKCLHLLLHLHAILQHVVAMYAHATAWSSTFSAAAPQVSAADLGNNFLVDEAGLGDSRAKVTAELLVLLPRADCTKH